MNGTPAGSHRVRILETVRAPGFPATVKRHKFSAPRYTLDRSRLPCCFRKVRIKASAVKRFSADITDIHLILLLGLSLIVLGGGHLLSTNCHSYQNHATRDGFRLCTPGKPDRAVL